MKFLLLVLIFATLLHANALSTEKKAERKKVVCYFGSWAVYRPGNGKFDVENIDPQMCTHLMYGFAGLSYLNEIIVLDPYNDEEENWGRGAMKRFTNLKQQNYDLKVLIAIGGWNEGSEKYSKMVADPSQRRKFINSVIQFLKKHNYDGLDLDWEYPANREGAAPEDKENFVSLVRELRVEFDKYGYLLTAAVSAGENTIKTAYDIPAISKDFDFISVMAYDMHGAWENVTGHHAPLHANPNLDFNDNLKLNLVHAINYWIDNGCPPEKLVLGMGTYGRGFTLDDPTVNGLYAPARLPIDAGPYTREPGTWGYNEICERFRLEPGQWTVVEDLFYESPYAFRERQWIGFDSPESISRKVEFAIQKGLGGGMIWSLETDDFRGDCGEPFTIIKTIYRGLNGEIPLPPPTTTTTFNPNNTQPTTTTTTQKPPPPTDVCKWEGYNRDPAAEPCSTSFFQCVPYEGGWQIYPKTCAPGTFFYEDLQACTFPQHIPECENEVENLLI